MTSRERVKVLLNKEIPDKMGIYEHFWPETIRDNWINQGFPEDKVPESLFDYDLTGCGSWVDTEPFMGRSKVVQETDEWVVTKDGRGATMKTWKKKSGCPEHMGFEVTTQEKWKEYRQPLLEVNRNRLGDINQAKISLENARKNNKFSFFGNMFVFELLRATLGHENFLPAMLLEPEWIKDFCQVYLDFYRKHYEILFREAGIPDGFFIYEDWGYNKGLFCSPSTMRELIIPYEKQLVSFFKDYGMQVILHSCGDIRKAIPLIIEAGFDCLQPMESKAGCNVVEIASEYGRKLSYMGNINVVPLSTNDKKQVEAEIVPKLIKLKKMRIPYFFHSDHSIPPNISLKTYQYALALFMENNSY
ncbi:hypothetical protein AUJ66_01705 [Candidatus Desantisbacteria bacterium CG1_02_38_46]|uniref:Uroporphyrinogen decarboxylase (URO-D) domain-containing protein n=1 Tax=Candidatus Desantisbacteria bacterium CG1_02_38_46 TaxID=1817893 RepID=A0A1J4SF84_9BACT|nr:MAG: hypothetical protein AUJ66_01705 [Candidatus Desantisbacteria bacterium CG1_02_38_46]